VAVVVATDVPGRYTTAFCQLCATSDAAWAAGSRTIRPMISKAGKRSIAFRAKTGSI
jgi:hypothetical protein